MANSHIQMPRAMLKRFEDRHHKLCYYDVEKGILGTNGYAASINTQEGYYSDYSESLLNRNFEKPFYDLMKTVDEIDIDPPRGHIDSNFDYVAKHFVYSLYARDPAIIPPLKEFPAVYHLLLPVEIRDLAMSVGLGVILDGDILQDYGTTLAINTTETPFVLPTCGAYPLKILGFEDMVLPVSPNKAIVFVEPRGKSRIIKDDVVFLYSVETAQDVEVFNNTAFSTQCTNGNGYVVSHSRSALENAWKRTKEQR